MKASEEELEQSEFGRGLVICLVKFAEHRWRWEEQKHFYEEMRQKHPESHFFSESQSIERHFNGASDHLYEIQVPPEWQDKEIGRKVKELQSLGLEIGHGFTKKTWTEADVTKVYELCQEIAILIDQELGLKPNKGTW